MYLKPKKFQITENYSIQELLKHLIWGCTTYPNIEFHILVRNCLYIETYSWYRCDRLTKFKFV